jgi:thymidylate synthase (FAD)
MRPSGEPKVFLIARPQVDWVAIDEYLSSVGGQGWSTRARGDAANDPQLLIEFMGRLCYRSWEPALNANVTKIRQDSGRYLENLLASAHGSVLEHVNYSFVIAGCSRVFTHELVRHRAGTAVSQESLRYVRLTDIPLVPPQLVEEDPELRLAADQLLSAMESFQILAAERAGLDDPGTDFAQKKAATSAMRRYAPEGVATAVAWTANVRALRHIIALRTSPAAEDEMRQIFDQVAQIVVAELPDLFADFVRHDDGSWVPQYAKV